MSEESGKSRTSGPGAVTHLLPGAVVDLKLSVGSVTVTISERLAKEKGLV